jgi:hypothetical protein
MNNFVEDARRVFLTTQGRHQLVDRIAPQRLAVESYGSATAHNLHGWDIVLSDVHLSEDWEMRVYVTIAPALDDGWRAVLRSCKRRMLQTSEKGSYVVVTERMHLFHTDAKVVAQSFDSEGIGLVTAAEFPALFAANTTSGGVEYPRDMALRKHIEGLKQELSDAEVLAFDLDQAISDATARI